MSRDPILLWDHSLYEAWCLAHPEPPRRTWMEWCADLIAWIVVGK